MSGKEKGNRSPALFSHQSKWATINVSSLQGVLIVFFALSPDFPKVDSFNIQGILEILSWYIKSNFD